MEMVLVALKDNVSGMFDQPGLVHNVEEGKRQVSILISKSENFKNICKDYSLYKVGLYDNQSGIIIPELDFVCNVIDLVGDVNA